MAPTRPARRVAVATVVLGWSLGIAQERRESEAALSAVRKEINALQERLARETARRDEGAQALRAAEVEIATATRSLAELRGNLETQQAARRDLAQETEQAKRRLAAEQAALARQVRSSYMTGREELFKLLLSQESPASSRTHARLLRLLQPRALRAHRRGRRRAHEACGARAGNESRSKRSSRRSKRRRRARSRRSRRSRDERRAAVAKLDADIRDGTAAVGKLRGRGAAARGPREAR